MAYPQGAIAVARDPFGNSSARPYLVLLNDRHPFHGQEYVGAVVTTTARDPAIALEEEDFVQGELPEQSYVSPWNPVTLKAAMTDEHVATVADDVVDDAVAELNTYLATSQ